MNIQHALLRAALFASVPIATYAQTQAVYLEAEDVVHCTLGSTMSIGNDGAIGYVTTTKDDTGAPTDANRAEKVASCSVTFPEAGNYEL